MLHLLKSVLIYLKQEFAIDVIRRQFILFMLWGWNYSKANAQLSSNDSVNVYIHVLHEVEILKK